MRRKLQLALKVATFTMPAVEIASIWWELVTLPCWLQWAGAGIAAVGVGFFIAGMLTMKGSWRAGIPEKKETSLGLFHKQILGEEQFLEGAFGEEYADYKKRVRRYL